MIESNKFEKNRNIVLYGLSTETERILNEWNGKYNVIGLLDGFQKEGMQFGYPIVNINDVVKQENVIIIVVARPGSCKAITKRIGNLCRENGVGLFDIRGTNLLADTRVVFDFKNVKGYTKAELLEQIREVDVVSFDLFDTLVVRKVLSSSDVIELVGAWLEEKGVLFSDFVAKRIATEKKLSRGHAPRLEQIYEELLKDEKNAVITATELAVLEYQVDVGLLQPRAEIQSLISEIKAGNKQVYITSESYYSRAQIEYILSVNGISDVDGVIVSCEYDTGKLDDLFEKLIEVAGTKNILHIGDDIVADIESASKHGIKSFQIYSASEILDSVGGLNLISNDMCLSDRIRVGMFIADIFNSPFQFEDENQKIHVDDAKNLGYLFTAPMIMDFTKWFGEQVKEYGLNNIWFCARDGYLLKKLYELIYPGVKAYYFLTSRISTIRAGMEDITDIEYVDSMKYSGQSTDNLKARFGIDEAELSTEQMDCSQAGLLKYAEAILDVSKVKRVNYLKYIERLDIQDGGIALFDFVAKGTSQMYIQRLVTNPIKGLYFLQLEPEFMKNKELDIKPFYTEEERDTSAIFDNYYILETLLTSPDASVDEFDSDGNAIYANETRSQRDIECFTRAQEGIVSYVENYLAICPRNEIRINKKLDEAFLALVHNVEIRDKDFLDLTVEDPFFNRMTKITDVL